MIGDAYRQVVARSLLGAHRSPLVPSVVWLSWMGPDELGARVRVENSDDMWEATDFGVTNASTIDGGLAGDWTVTAIGLYDRQVGGNLIAAVDVSPAIATSTGDAISVPAGGLSIEVAA